MKKIFAFILVVMLMLNTVAFADADSIFDLTELTTEELIALKIQINDELNNRDRDTENDEVWYDDGGVKIICTKYGLKNGYSGLTLVFDLIVENNSDKAIYAGFRNDYINGWSIGTTGNFCKNSLAAGKKIKTSETIGIYHGDDTLSLDSIEDIAEYTFTLWVDLDKENYSDKQIEIEKTITVFPIYK